MGCAKLIDSKELDPKIIGDMVSTFVFFGISEYHGTQWDLYFFHILGMD